MKEFLIALADLLEDFQADIDPVDYGKRLKVSVGGEELFFSGLGPDCAEAYRDEEEEDDESDEDDEDFEDAFVEDTDLEEDEEE